MKNDDASMKNDDARAISLAALRLLFGDALGRDVGVRLWDGTRIDSPEKRFGLVLNDPGALRAALLPPNDMNAGRAFIAGLIDCEGDLEACIDTLLRVALLHKPRELGTLARLLLRLPKPRKVAAPRVARFFGRKHSRIRDQRVIGYHYDQPLEFYRAILDRQMVYSCAYFDDGIDDLDAAQIAKIDYTLDKLQLRPGDRLLDIGCGWGALVERAAKRFGARVLGITLSRSQHEYASERLRAAGLDGQARVELRDYRELRGEPMFDKIVSIGMVEHVGYKQLPSYFRIAFDALRTGGLFLNHGIADQTPGRRVAKDHGFISRYVFPDGHIIPLSLTNVEAERGGFEVRDVENLREHYARTLRAWTSNLRRNRDAAVTAAGEAAFRTWLLYMAGSAQGFASGRLGLFQTLLAKPAPGGSVELPATRRSLYERRTA